MNKWWHLASMKALLSVTAVVGFGLLCFTAACGSDSDGGNNRSGTALSCTLKSGSTTQCAEFSGGSESDKTTVRNNCTQTGGTIGQGCPTSGVSGVCTVSGPTSGSRIFYYGVNASDLATIQAACTQSQGTWSTS